MAPFNYNQPFRKVKKILRENTPLNGLILLVNRKRFCYGNDMLANYGYKDGSGEFYITVDTDKCTGCGECVTACPVKVLVTVADESDPFREIPVAVVTEEHRKKIKYSCASCKPVAGRKELPCIFSCQLKAIRHSW